MKLRRRRNGYAMMLVVAFLAMILTVWSMVYRQTATALRVETVQTLRARRDEGSIHALARGVTLLETGRPPANPYVCGVTIATSEGSRSFTVTFTATSSNGWSIQSSPAPVGARLAPMPSTFGP